MPTLQVSRLSTVLQDAGVSSDNHQSLNNTEEIARAALPALNPGSEGVLASTNLIPEVELLVLE